MAQLLDFNIIPLQYITNRRLQSQIPKRVQKYVEVLSKKWNDFGIDKRLKKIHEAIRNGTTTTLERDLNNLDKNITDSLTHAEKKCCRLPTSSLNRWSP